MIKKLKKYGLFMPLLLLAACSPSNAQEQVGLWQSIINILSEFILFLSNIFGENNYAVGIILFTLITRIILLPLLQYQAKTSRKSAELQPEIKRLRELYSSRDRQTQEQLQQAIKDLNEKNGVNQWAGCLPALIQLPLMIALYQAVISTTQLQEGHFFWAELGKPDPYYILPILAAFFTWLNGYLTVQGQPKDATQLKGMQLYVMPGLIFVMGMTLNSALTLYWVVGNIFAVIQTLVFNNPYKIREEREAKARQERNKKRAIKRAKKNAYKSKK